MRSRNPCPLGIVRVQRFCHLNGSLLPQSWVVPTTTAKGDSNEPIQKTIRNCLALPIPYRVGSQVSSSHLGRHVGHEVGNSIRAFSQQKEIEIVEMNIQPYHVLLLLMIPPKVSVLDYYGMVKGRSAIRVFNKFKELKERTYCGNHFWTEGYCVDTVGLDLDITLQRMVYLHTIPTDDDSKGCYHIGFDC